MKQARLFSSEPLRRCVRCLVEKPPKDFAWRDKAKGKRFAHCRACQAEYHRKHYNANRSKYIERTAARKKEELERRWRSLVGYLRDHPCVDCGEKDIVVLEFDHVEDKNFEIAAGIRNRSWKDVIAEIERCEVVCANCHRRRTMIRGGFWRSTPESQRDRDDSVERVKVIETS